MSGKPNPSKLGDADLDYSMDESVRRFARCQDRKHLQEARTQLEESDANKLDTFRKNFAEKHNYAALASKEEPLPLPNSKRPTYDSLYIPLFQDAGMYYVCLEQCISV